MSGATDFVVTFGGRGCGFFAFAFAFPLPAALEVFEESPATTLPFGCPPGTKAGASALNSKSFGFSPPSAPSSSEVRPDFVNRPSNRRPVFDTI